MKFDIEKLTQGLLEGERTSLSRAITLIESKNQNHQKLAKDLLQNILPHTGKSYRIGITGVPGVGKSTAIEALGCYLVENGYKVAVLAIDPSSTMTKGSILGDKTRMSRLSELDRAFIRPSPSAGTLGGVAIKTRETMLLCEAAGFDITIIETVGAGQSEIAVSSISDVFLVLMLPNAGDELQGIKKGVLELADIICLNKVDGDNEILAKKSIAEYRSALKILSNDDKTWATSITSISALKNLRIDELWSELKKFKKITQNSGDFDKNRQSQQVNWIWDLFDEKIKQILANASKNNLELKKLEDDVKNGTITPEAAADKIFKSLKLSST